MQRCWQIGRLGGRRSDGDNALALESRRAEGRANGEGKGSVARGSGEGRQSSDEGDRPDSILRRGVLGAMVSEPMGGLRTRACCSVGLEAACGREDWRAVSQVSGGWRAQEIAVVC